ncbi:hypothetical protein Vretimale_2352 [Volvox reticuliferus]|nr:hypothetical protein Vretimale_2352 [Volvox reticuliferus]
MRLCAVAAGNPSACARENCEGAGLSTRAAACEGEEGEANTHEGGICAKQYVEKRRKMLRDASEVGNENTSKGSSRISFLDHPGERPSMASVNVAAVIVSCH